MNKNVVWGRFCASKGFTLIELLVVVLIIGILAAVAVPQYQKAVEKSQATEALTMLKTVYQAAEVYFLNNGSWPSEFSQLDVDIPWSGNIEWYRHQSITDTRSNQNWSIQMHPANVSNIAGVMIGRISGPYAGAGLVLWHSYPVAEDIGTQIYCTERTSDGIVLSGTPGRYCEKIFGGKQVPVPSAKMRYYKI